ncbi:hypothetical protein [Mesorhizobium sp. B1-1-8]|uniref:hypothetical protein n=1 Tax=Mesorhizobium sp. B1-1-8 TaxID=2589976 RepID=UPI0039AFD62B
MTSRTTPTVVRFNAAFMLPGFDAPHPAGAYGGDLDEESLEAASRTEWLCSFTYQRGPRTGPHSKWCPSNRPHSKRRWTRTGDNDDHPHATQRTPIQHGAPARLFEIRQAVRLEGGIGVGPKTDEIYRVTLTLQSKRNSPQYRVRSESEPHDRVVTEEGLDLVDTCYPATT